MLCLLSADGAFLHDGVLNETMYSSKCPCEHASLIFVSLIEEVDLQGDSSLLSGAVALGTFVLAVCRVPDSIVVG